MSIETEKPKVSLIEYHRKYQRERMKGTLSLNIKPSAVKKLRIYYDEYVVTCQQNQYATVEFHDFILQFCEIGFFSWRDRNKHK